MTTDQIERRARCLHSDAVAAEGGIGLAREELSVVPHADIDQTGRLVLGAAARALDPESSTVYQFGDVVQDPDYSQALSYPVYRITFTTGANEDQRDWTVFALNTDSHTYFYAFRATPQAAEDLSDLYSDIFSQLTLADPAQ